MSRLWTVDGVLKKPRDLCESFELSKKVPIGYDWKLGPRRRNATFEILRWVRESGWSLSVPRLCGRSREVVWKAYVDTVDESRRKSRVRDQIFGFSDQRVGTLSFVTLRSATIGPCLIYVYRRGSVRESLGVAARVCVRRGAARLGGLLQRPPTVSGENSVGF